MSRDLVLHLGDFKTGSTAIQQLLSQDAAAQGICYPPGFNHAALAQALPDPVTWAAEDHFDVAARDSIALWGAMLRAGLTAPGGAALLDRLYHE